MTQSSSRRQRTPDHGNPCDDTAEAPTLPPDPALVLAEVLLRRALRGNMKKATTSFVWLVKTPSNQWSEIIAKAWTALNKSDTQSEDEGGEHSYGGEDWIALVCSKPGQRHYFEFERQFESALPNGVSVTIFTHDDGLLPEDIAASADLQIEVRPPCSEDLSETLRRLTGKAPKRVPTESEAAQVTPRLMRLARRLDESADNFTVRLRRLLDRPHKEAKAEPLKDEATPHLTRLHGMREAVDWGLSLARDIAAYQAGKLPWTSVDAGCLLSGPPGVGKTLFARALAETCGVPLVHGSYSMWHASGSSHQGDLLKAMHRTFEKARATAPSILFVDEIDSFPDRAAVTHHYADWERQVVNGLLAEVDGIDGREGVVFLGACNDPDKLDPALKRSGRLDRHIRLTLPGPEDLVLILREHLGADLAGEDLTAIGLLAIGSTGADCEKFVRGARRRARDANRPMQLADLHAELKGGREQTNEELLVAAVHEAGHALIALELGGFNLEAISIRSGPTTGGRVMARSDAAHLSMHKVHNRLMFHLAGRAAEEVVFGEASSGAGGGSDSDLAQATRLATLAIGCCGLDNEAGLVWRGAPSTTSFSAMLNETPELMTRVRSMLSAAYRETSTLLRSRRRVIHIIAEALIDRSALDGDEVRAIVTRHLASGTMETPAGQ